MSVSKYYLNTQILMLVFKYILRVFKYLTITYYIHPVKKYALSYCAYLGIHDFAELSEEQRRTSKIFRQLTIVVETQMSVSLSIHSIWGLTSK